MQSNAQFDCMFFRTLPKALYNALGLWYNVLENSAKRRYDGYYCFSQHGNHEECGHYTNAVLYRAAEDEENPFCRVE